MKSPNEQKRKRRLSDVPKPVRERWMHIKGLRWAKAIARAYMRWRLPIAERRRRKALIKTFQTVKHYAIKSENGRFRGSSILFNIGLYLLIADRDIQAIKLEALTHPDEWTRKLSARIILITIYEWDADKVSGRAFKEALDIMGIPDDLKARAIEALRTLRLVQRKVTKHFSFLRNATIGHRDADALAQYRAIRNLRVEDVMAIAVEFFAATEEFVDVLTQIMLASSSFHSYLRQWMESEKPRLLP
ncbi:hypothetical protein [Bradyrhizobium sp. SSUT77]|uniref:hypothetical protein n=1 Tax=Bradyrhizobium sp. SSUT77 TaxID=3040603 RepID=UPI002449EE1A|nr:hypothetical protein [Bradyrhizobium sp. SSUT77]MDH2340992.1 hypothetical protein [Bradyrhizobium sp. SSUT77]